MNYAGNTEIRRKHFNHHQQNLCIAVLSIIPLRKTFSFYRRLFLIKELSKIYSRTFQGYPGLFNDRMLFQALFKASANHVM